MNMNKFRRGWFQRVGHSEFPISTMLILGVLIYSVLNITSCRSRKKKQTATLEVRIVNAPTKEETNQIVIIDNWFLFIEEIEISGFRDGKEDVHIVDRRIQQITDDKKFNYTIPSGRYDYLNVSLYIPEGEEEDDDDDDDRDNNRTPSVFIKGRLKADSCFCLPTEKTVLIRINEDKVIKFDGPHNKSKELSAQGTYVAILNLNISKWLNSIPKSLWIDAALEEFEDTIIIIDEDSHEDLYEQITRNIGKGATLTIKEAP
ncbi:MAG: hypothetical protein GXO48_02225 [Chlorobi bacterium]|nr:hypothetical protein [Chlorobiota bacterium]